MAQQFDPQDLKDIKQDLVPANQDDQAVEKSSDEQMADSEGPFGHEGNAEPADIDLMRAAFNLKTDNNELPDFEKELNPNDNLPVDDDLDQGA